MKQLQNNYTTPEQSKRLLKLGVPADSADCCLRRILTDGGYCETWRVDIFDFIGQIHDDYLPCWSVGRLMEIYDTCDAEYMHKGWDCYFDLTIDYIEFVVRMFEFDIPRGKIDLSRLEGEQ